MRYTRAVGLRDWFTAIPEVVLRDGERVLLDERDAVVYRKVYAKLEGRLIITDQRLLFYAKQSALPFLRDLPIPAIDASMAGARVSPHEQIPGGIEVTPGRHAFDVTFPRGDVTVVEVRDVSLDHRPW